MNRYGLISNRHPRNMLHIASVNNIIGEQGEQCAPRVVAVQKLSERVNDRLKHLRHV
jgi:hypothetical protein